MINNERIQSHTPARYSVNSDVVPSQKYTASLTENVVNEVLWT